MKAALFIALLLFTGCALFKRQPKISIPGIVGQSSPVSVVAPQDNGKAATVDSSTEQTGIRVPKDSIVTVTKIDAIPATETKPAVPATQVVTFQPSADTEWRQQSQKVAANTGTVDTSVALHRIDAAQRIWLLWGGIASLIGGMVVKSLVPAWPSLSSGLLLSGVALIGAWKFAEIPAWISLVIGGVVLALIAGYKRAEWDKNGDGIPDFIKRKTP